MKEIKELWQKYINKSAVIFANGPSLLKFTEKMDVKNLPDNFYDGVWFGINYSFEKFPEGYRDLEYIFVQELETYEILRKVLPNKKLIVPSSPGLNRHGTAERVRIENDEAYGYNLQNPMENKKEDLPNKDYGIDKNVKFFSYTTTTQSAMHICCYMGFSKIYLIGVDYQMFPDGRVHYDSKFDKRYGPQQMRPLGRHQQGDTYLIPALEKTNNVKIINMGKMLT